MLFMCLCKLKLQNVLCFTSSRLLNTKQCTPKLTTQRKDPFLLHLLSYLMCSTQVCEVQDSRSLLHWAIPVNVTHATTCKYGQRYSWAYCAQFNERAQCMSWCVCEWIQLSRSHVEHSIIAETVWLMPNGVVHYINGKSKWAIKFKEVFSVQISIDLQYRGVGTQCGFRALMNFGSHTFT